MKSVIFWDVTPCSLLNCNRRVGGTYRLHLQVRRKNYSKNQQVSKWHLAGFRWNLFFEPEDGGDRFLRYVGRNCCENLKSYLIIHNGEPEYRINNSYLLQCSVWQFYSDLPLGDTVYVSEIADKDDTGWRVAGNNMSKEHETVSPWFIWPEVSADTECLMNSTVDLATLTYWKIH
jgi:hypothetical protein